MDSRFGPLHKEQVKLGYSIILAGLVFLLSIRPSVIMFLMVSAVVSWFVFIIPAVGITGWIMLIPLEPYLIEHIEFSPFLILAPAVISSFALRSLVISHISFHKKGIWFGLLFIFVSLISLLMSHYFGVYGLRMIVSVAVGVTIMVLIAWIIRTDKNGFWLIGHSIIFAFFIALYVGVSDFEETAWQLTVGGSVRQLSNITALSLIILVFGFLTKKKSKWNLSIFPYQKMRFLQFIFLIIAAISLISMVSRGTIVAVLLAIVAIVLASIVFRAGALMKVDGWKILTLAIILISVGFIGFVYVDQVITKGHLITRIALALSDPGENVRWTIWSAAFSQMRGIEWLIGAGPGTFRTLAIAAGYDFYAHSVFFDVLVTVGILGLGILTTFLMFIAFKLWSTKNAIGLGLFVFLVVSFATHGSLSTKHFWVTLGLLYGLAYSPYVIGVRVRNLDLFS